MLAKPDIEQRSLFVINAYQAKSLSVKNGELYLQDSKTEKTLTKFPFQKILALLIIGNYTITSPLLEKCHQHAVAVIITKMNLRPVLVYASHAEANFLLRQKQYEAPAVHLNVAKQIVINKIMNYEKLLKNSRQRDTLIDEARSLSCFGVEMIKMTNDFSLLMGIEGRCAQAFFKAFYQNFEWKGRRPRTKIDPLNVALDIGYTMLFNIVEIMVRLFGFDPYRGVYHQLWFKRKSLICDLMEPFRPIIDFTTRKSFHLKEFSEKDFELEHHQYRLKPSRSSAYYKKYASALIDRKVEIFIYVRHYYRAFMKDSTNPIWPPFQY